MFPSLPLLLLILGVQGHDVRNKGLESFAHVLSHTKEVASVVQPRAVHSRSLLQSDSALPPVQQIYSAQASPNAPQQNSLQSLVLALKAAFSVISHPPSAAVSTLPSASSPGASSIIVIDGTAMVKSSALWPLTADIALRLRCIQWNALKDQVYDFQMLTANQAANSTKAAPQVAIRFRYLLRNAFQDSANFEDLLQWAAQLPSNFSSTAKQLYGWNASFALQNGSIVREIDAAGLPNLEAPTSMVVPTNISVLAITVSLSGSNLVPFNSSHQSDLLTAYLEVMQEYGVVWVDLSSISEAGAAPYSSVYSSLSSRRLLVSPDTGSQSVHVGMHLAFAADNLGGNSSGAQASLNVPQAQQSAQKLLQAQGPDGTMVQVSLTIAIPKASYYGIGHTGALRAFCTYSFDRNMSLLSLAVALPLAVGTKGDHMALCAQDSTSLASDAPATNRPGSHFVAAGQLSPPGPTASTPSSDSLVLFARAGNQTADPVERLQLVMQQSTEHQSALQRWQAKEQERQAAMAELAAFAQYRLKEGKLFKGLVMSGEMSRSQEHIMCRAVRAEQRQQEVTIKLYAFNAGALSEQGACEQMLPRHVMPRAAGRCPEELGVDGGTTPACILLEPVGRTLAHRLRHLAAEPLAPQEQVRCSPSLLCLILKANT
ncbi:hypothetical protein WJX84_008097 [Apatococcus fuscideae]|uniref:Uncharacterized protein n=1 Tax=Apatococcus fuscideae TaxID=2026836 RepID=A0AAW1STW4_9CHLO